MSNNSHYVSSPDGRFAVMDLPPGTVALDIDAPSDFYNEEPGRSTMIEGARKLARRLSEQHNLGLFWLYRTGHGLHVLFENCLPSYEEAQAVLDRAGRQRRGWHECPGHAAMCRDTRAVQIRIGHKPSRPWDIEPVPGNPPVSCAPAHIREHERLLSQRLPAL